MITKKKNQKNFLTYIQQIADQYSLSNEKVSDFLKESFKNNFLREYSDNSIGIEIDLKKGNIDMWRNLEIVSDSHYSGQGMEDEETIITLDEAKKLDPIKGKKLKVGDSVKKTIDISEFDLRLVKSILSHFQKLTLEKINERVFETWIKYKGLVLEGMVEKIDERKDQSIREIIVALTAPDGTTAKAVINKYDLVHIESPHGFKIPETLVLGNIYYFFVKDVLENCLKCPIILSRTDGAIVKHLMKKHISEVFEEHIEIKQIARIAGLKTKVLVSSKRKNLDPVGCCIGPKGKRLKIISNQILNEKIDVILWSDDPVKNVINAFVPGKILGYRLDGENEITLVATLENLLSAIGKKGVNSKLVCMLTNWKVNLKTIQEAKNEKIHYINVEDSKNNNISNISSRIYDIHYMKNEEFLNKINDIQDPTNSKETIETINGEKE